MFNYQKTDMETLDRRSMMELLVTTALIAATTGCESKTVPDTTEEEPDIQKESSVICTQSLSEVIDKRENERLPGDTLRYRELTLRCEGSTFTLGLQNHSVFPLPGQATTEKWREREQGDGSEVTSFLWDRDNDHNVIIGHRSNCAATAFQIIGMSIPDNSQVMAGSSRELLNVLEGFDHPNAPGGHAPGIGTCVAIINEDEFDVNPGRVMDQMQPGDIAYFITIDNDGREDYHIATYALHPETRKPTLYQTVSIAGPSGYGRPEALKYLYENWTTIEGVSRPSRVIEVHVIRPTAIIKPLSKLPISDEIENPRIVCRYDELRSIDPSWEGRYYVRTEHISHTNIAGLLKYACGQIIGVV